MYGTGSCTAGNLDWPRQESLVAYSRGKGLGRGLCSEEAPTLRFLCMYYIANNVWFSYLIELYTDYKCEHY